MVARFYTLVQMCEQMMEYTYGNVKKMATLIDLELKKRPRRCLECVTKRLLKKYVHKSTKYKTIFEIFNPVIIIN